MRLKWLAVFLISILLVSNFGLTKVVLAATAAPTTSEAATVPVAAPAIALTPAIQYRVLSVKDTNASFTVQLANQTDESVTLTISSKDFGSLGQSGGLTFTTSGDESATKGHGLSDMLRIDTPRITLPAKSIKTITARVNDVSKLAPGGHYVAILANVVPDTSRGANNQVVLNQALSSLVFLETAGQGTKTLKLLQPRIKTPVFTLPSSLNLIFQATGNTQTTPRGIVTISRGDQTLSKAIINENSSLVLPGSTRLFATALNGNHRPFWPGQYTMRIQYHYDDSLGITTYQKQFYYINIFSILLAISVVGIATLLTIRFRHLYIRNLNKKSSK